MFVLPFAASVLFVWLASKAVPAPDGTVGFVLWWIGLSAAGSLVMWVVDRVARRLLPLAALLQLSLVFPDQAPSRFKAAMDSGRVNQLEERLALTRQAANAGTPAEAARLLLTLVATLSAHDRITRGHSERVRGYAVMIGRELGLSDSELDQLNWAALLHDIGKLEVATEILNKPGRPSEEEWQQLKRHPLYGETLIEPMRPWLGEWADAVGYHHERWDGEGYPRGVAGEEIPLPGRIVAIADVFDVITSARSYKDPGSPTAGREEIARCAGAQFDPRLVRAFLNVSLGRMRLVMGPLSWLAHLPILGRLPIASVANTVWGAAGLIVATTASGLAGTATPGHEAQALAARPAVIQQAAEVTRAEPAREAVARHRTRRAADDGQTVPADAPVMPQDPMTLPPVTPTPAPSTPATPTPTPTPTPSAPEPAETPLPTSADAVPATPVAPETLPPLTPTPVASAPEPAPTPTPAPTPVVLTPVAPVPNHAPSFAAGADRTVAEDSGPSATPGWASDVDPGPFESGQAVTFTVDNDDHGLFSAQPAVTPAGTLTFTPAPDAHGTATVTVRAVDDGGTAAGGDDTSAPQTFTITITSVNDAPRFTAGAAQTLPEDAGAHVFPGWAMSVAPGPADESGQAVTFTVDNDDHALFSAQPAVSPAGTLTFTPAPDAHGTATVTVRAVDDGGTANGGEDTSAPQTITITITSVNDAPRFTAGADQTVPESSGAASVSGWASGISPGAADESGQSVSFMANNDEPSLFSAQPAISPGGTLTFTPAAGAHGVATVTVRAVDDGGTANGGDDTSAPQTLTITIQAPNRAPSFTGGADQTVLEDSGSSSVSGWATGISAGPSPEEDAQAVSFLVTNPFAALFSAAPAVSPGGSLTFTPAANANGATTVTVRVTDDGGTANGGVDTSAAQTFMLTVTPVNDAPSFAAGGNQGIVLNGSLQSIAGWATAISPGPANESGQTVAFTVTNTNPGLFAVQPRVDPDGTLVYQPTFALGTATVTVRAVDTGGTANGGADTSAPQSFTITVVL
ncbi:HD domain-containing phosphohydrolase [Baekduia sp. Peel2402]|uniref:HD domain-containing phosphohydrolase n=1 Tax=Baekduia sp. Peel2402 TaxID=3458296 RepID=UPI00403E7885